MVEKPVVSLSKFLKESKKPVTLPIIIHYYVEIVNSLPKKILESGKKRG